MVLIKGSQACVLCNSWTIHYEIGSVDIAHNNEIQCFPLRSLSAGPEMWALGHNVLLCPLTYGTLALRWPWKILRINSSANSNCTVQSLG